jgi:hypothetical protein
LHRKEIYSELGLNLILLCTTFSYKCTDIVRILLPLYVPIEICYCFVLEVTTRATRSSSNTGEESSNILDCEPQGISTKSLNEHHEDTEDKKEGELDNMMDSQLTLDSETNGNKGNNSKEKQDSPRITRKRGEKISTAGKTPKKIKESFEKAKTKVIGTGEPLVTLLAHDNHNLIVGMAWMTVSALHYMVSQF